LFRFLNLFAICIDTFKYNQQMVCWEARAGKGVLCEIVIALRKFCESNKSNYQLTPPPPQYNHRLRYSTSISEEILNRISGKEPVMMYRSWIELTIIAKGLEPHFVRKSIHNPSEGRLDISKHKHKIVSENKSPKYSQGQSRTTTTTAHKL
jgi:hypothetical protein